MFEKLRKILSKFKNNNEGLSIVTVIVAIGFVLIIVSIIMTTSTINFKMKNVNYYAKDSFYSSEQVLDEINAGLQQLVSEGLSTSYKEVLTTYGAEDFNSTEKNELVKNAFYEYIIDKLGYQVDGTTWRYIAMPTGNVYASHADATAASVKEGLYTYIKSTTRWNNGTIDSAYGAFLRGKNGAIENDAYYGEMKVTEKDGIYLKDLIVYFRDSNGVVSEVKTDIHIVYPDFAFSNPSMPEISTYTFITDSGLLQKKAGVKRDAALTTKIIGNSFAYKVEAIGTQIDYAPSGVGASATVDTHVVATDLDIVNGGIKTYENSRLWAEDIIAKSSRADLDGYTYVKDDMDLQGKNPVLNIVGNYIGYGNSLSSSEESSAILVNGVNAEIDLQYVKKLSLAGRAFIGLSKASSNTVSNVYIGSSIAAKSDQLMYLIPGDCLGVDSENNSRFGKNPLTQAEYETIMEPANNLTLIARGKKLGKLGNTGDDKLDDYIKEGDEGYKRVEVSAKDGSKLYYFYMAFKNDDAANLFFEKYYNANKNSVDKYLDQYIKKLSFPDGSDAMLRVSMAGNTLEDSGEVVVGYKADGTEIKKKNHEVAGIHQYKKPGAENIADSFEDENKSYSEQFIAYNTNLTPSLDNVAALIQRSGDNKAVFRNIVNQASFEDVIDGAGRLYFKDGSDEKVVLIHRNFTKNADGDPVITETVNLNSTDLGCNLIIADCNVVVPAGTNFEGTMLVQGTITVDSSTGGNTEFKANPKLVNRCMSLMDDTGVYYVFDVFNDVSMMSSAALRGKDSEDIYLSDLVEFSNWTRSADIDAGTGG